MNWELPDVQAGFRKGRGTRNQIANIHWIIEKNKGIPEKHLLLLHWLKLKPLTVWITTNWKVLKEMGISHHHTCLLYTGQEATFRTNVEHWTGSKLGKEYIKAVYCHPAYLTAMQSTSCEMLGWIKHKLESRLPGEISITSDMQMTPPLWQKGKTNWGASE